MEWMRGMPGSVETYKKTATGFQKIKSVFNVYQEVSNPTLSGIELMGVKVGFSKKPLGLYVIEIQNPAFYTYRSYFIRPRYAKLMQTTETLYDPDDASKFTSHITTYDYSFDHLNLTTQSTTASDGSELKSIFRYPPDFKALVGNSDWAASSLAKMTAKNMISSVVEQQVWQKQPGATDYRFLSGSLTKFKEFTAGRIYPAETYSYRTPAPVPSLSPATSVSNGVLDYDKYNPAQSDNQGYEPKLTYKSYDNKGNILSYQAENGLEVCIIWGYDDHYPAAEIKNATYAQVKAALGVSSTADISLGTGGLSAAQKTALRNALPQAQLTTYDYQPMVGVTSSTDAAGITTYYEYDGLQRLKRVKDQDGNIVKHYVYHYKGQ